MPIDIFPAASETGGLPGNNECRPENSKQGMDFDNWNRLSFELNRSCIAAFPLVIQHHPLSALRCHFLRTIDSLLQEKGSQIGNLDEMNGAPRELDNLPHGFGSLRLRSHVPTPHAWRIDTVHRSSTDCAPRSTKRTAESPLDSRNAQSPKRSLFK
jgi:hypothetical protein